MYDYCMHSVLNKKFIVLTVVFALTYIYLNVYFTNLQILNQAYFGHYPFEYKFDLTIALLEGLTTSLSPFNFYTLIIVSILTGLNIALLIKVLKNQAYQKVHLAFGIGSLFGIAGGGCASCGLPLLGLLGVSSSVMHLPFRGVEISILAMLLLSISFISLLKSIKVKCKVNQDG